MLADLTHENQGGFALSYSYLKQSAGLAEAARMA